MGTSSNQPSPNTPPWKPVGASLGRTNFSDRRQSEEIWQAAFADRGGQLIEELANPILAEAARIVERNENIPNAVTEYTQLLRSNYAAGLIFDIGKRALARATLNKSDSRGFAAELFAELASYYVARDLPSHVAAPGRVQTTSEAVTLKNSIANIARSTVLSNENLATDPEGWRSYINSVATSLQFSGTGA